MSERSAQFRDDLAARLGRVRGNMTDAEFAQLLTDVTNTAKRFAEIEAREHSNPALPSRGAVKSTNL